MLASELRMALRLKGSKATVTEATAQRQCDDEFIDELAEVIEDHALEDVEVIGLHDLLLRVMDMSEFAIKKEDKNEDE